MKMNSKIALVTGASSGIGEATAERLAIAGYKCWRRPKIDQFLRVVPTEN